MTDTESEFWKIAAETAKDAYFMHALNEIMDEGEDPDGVGASPDSPDDEDDDGTWAETLVAVDIDRLAELESAWTHVAHHDCMQGKHIVMHFMAGVLMALRQDVEDVPVNDEWDLDDPSTWI